MQDNFFQVFIVFSSFETPTVQEFDMKSILAKKARYLLICNTLARSHLLSGGINFPQHWRAKPWVIKSLKNGSYLAGKKRGSFLEEAFFNEKQTMPNLLKQAGLDVEAQGLFGEPPVEVWNRIWFFDETEQGNA